MFDPDLSPTGHLRLLDVTSPNLEVGLRLWEQGNHHGVSCDAATVAKLPNIPVLDVTVRARQDLGAVLERAQQLTHLSVEGQDGVAVPVDLTGFGHLEYLGLIWHPKVVFPEQMPSLRHAYLARYAPRANGAGRLPASLPALQSLMIGTGPAKEMPELPDAVNLRRLEVIGSRATDLGALAEYDLLHLRVGNCSKIENADFVAGLRGLREIAFSRCSRLHELGVLSRCARLESIELDDLGWLGSIRFARGLEVLRSFHCWDTNIRDGDLTPLIGVEDLHIEHRRHYSHSEDQLRALAASGRPKADAAGSDPEGVPARPAATPSIALVDAWRERTSDAEPQSPSGVDAIERVLSRFQREVSGIPDGASEDVALAIVKHAVDALNEVHHAFSDLIGTQEREDLVCFLLDGIDGVLDEGSDPTDAWREW